MKQNELKQLIRALVKECVNEVLAEKFMKSIIKETVQEAVLASVQNTRSNVQRQVVTEERVEQPRKMTLGSLEDDQRRQEEFLRRKRQLQDQQEVSTRQQPVQQPRKTLQESALREIANDSFREVFEDTMNSGHPLITGQDTGEDHIQPTNMDEIPEHVLEAAGVFNKDWSRHIS